MLSPAGGTLTGGISHTRDPWDINAYDIPVQHLNTGHERSQRFIGAPAARITRILQTPYNMAHADTGTAGPR